MTNPIQTDEAVYPASLNDFEEPMNALKGVTSTLMLMGEASTLDPEDRQAISWVADRLFDAVAELQDTIDSLKAAANPKREERVAA